MVAHLEAHAAVGAGRRDPPAIGGFSGRESQVSLAWLADAVVSGKLRWVMTGGDTRGLHDDGRIGASQVMAAVERVRRQASSVRGLYDLAGTASALRALAASSPTG